MGEGLLEYIGPLVETQAQEKPLSISLREIDAGLLTSARTFPESQIASGGTDNGLTAASVEVEKD